MVAPRVRALTKKKATKREEKEKKVVVVKVAPAECSRLNRDMSLSNRIFSLNGLSSCRSKIGRTRESSRLSLSFLRKKSTVTATLDSPRTPPKDDEEDFDDLLTLESLLLLSRVKVYSVPFPFFCTVGGGAFSKRGRSVFKKKFFSLFPCRV